MEIKRREIISFMIEIRARASAGATAASPLPRMASIANSRVILACGFACEARARAIKDMIDGSFV